MNPIVWNYEVYSCLLKKTRKPWKLVENDEKACRKGNGSKEFIKNLDFNVYELRWDFKGNKSYLMDKILKSRLKMCKFIRERKKHQEDKWIKPTMLERGLWVWLRLHYWWCWCCLYSLWIFSSHSPCMHSSALHPCVPELFPISWNSPTWVSETGVGFWRWP